MVQREQVTKTMCILYFKSKCKGFPAVFVSSPILQTSWNSYAYKYSFSKMQNFERFGIQIGSHKFI